MLLNLSNTKPNNEDICAVWFYPPYSDNTVLEGLTKWDVTADKRWIIMMGFELIQIGRYVNNEPYLFYVILPNIGVTNDKR
ncbi:MAG: hypothetical protein WC783_00535 [Candidatus Paceibacterota bacterium]|jgi:hypothetical protein